MSFFLHAYTIQNLHFYIDFCIGQYGYSYCQNGTRVMTIKSINYSNSIIVHSCDFAIVYNCSDGRQQYIRFNKKQNSFYWEYQNAGFKNLKNKEEWIVSNHKINEVKALYLEKKNYNDDSYKKSRSIYAETIHEVYKRYNY